MFWAFRRRFSYKLRSKGSKFVCMNGSSFVEISLKHFQSQTLRAWELKCVTCHMSRITCHMSHVTCHMSHVTCHMSYVTCHMSKVKNIFFLSFFQNGWSLSMEHLLSTEPTPFSFCVCVCPGYACLPRLYCPLSSAESCD